jgi:HTH-type transcriptional regulator/antitoxin HigA
MDEMGTLSISPRKYGSLLAKALPKVIENDRELEHFSEMLESLDRLGRELTPEEKALDVLLARLIADYDEKTDLPELPAHETIAFLMRQKGLKQADLLPVFGSRSVASDVLNGKREPSKAHIRKLAEFFDLSPATFF